MPNVSIKRSRSREERARKVVQGIRQRLKAGHLPDRKKRKGWKKSEKLRQLGDVGCLRRASSLRRLPKSNLA